MINKQLTRIENLHFEHKKVLAYALQFLRNLPLLRES